ncbi:MAG: hypothetical protein N0C84_02700 [Candidatus Thiodiazotropha taylori]|nr:hypothetical protein [Candidatus Thiodiazotropha taylori]
MDRMSRYKCYAVILFIMLSGCGGGSGESINLEEQPVNPSALPLLSSGGHISLFKSFNAEQPVVTDSAMQARWNDALNQGMDVARIQVDWADLEPQPNQYNTDLLLEELMEMQQSGLQAFVLLSTIDSEGYTLPQDLSDENSGTKLVNGIQFDDPLITSRFESLLDWVVPMVVEYGGWVLAVGNEPGNFLMDYPEAEASVVNFLRSARRHVRTLDERLAVTMTLAYENQEMGSSFHSSLLAEVDVASYNYYAINPDLFFEGDLSTVNRELDAMLNAAGDKPVIFQELGASAGYEETDSPMNASLSRQTEFFDAFFNRMSEEQRIRVAVIFQLVDWDPDLVESEYAEALRADGLPEDMVQRFSESYETMGLIRYADGSSRPAWNRVLQAISHFSQAP